MRIKALRTLIILCTLTCSVVSAFAQRDSLNQVSVLVRPSLDSIVLRWAPTNLNAWIKGNQFGYTIERYTLAREGQLLSQPEKTVIVDKLKPRPLNAWEQLVRRNKYAAIAAQALYGDSFQLTTQGTDVFQIVNKVKENEQRFSIALFAADIDAAVSLFHGLRFTDKQTKRGEKYLYRLICVSQPSMDTIRGSVFTEPSDYSLPAPADFTAEFNGPLVSLKWNQSYYHGVFSAFVVERSADGKDFKPLSPDPQVTLSEDDKEESRYQYATDSLPDNGTEYHYRVRGLSPFGELGPPSTVITGKGSLAVNDPPHILEGRSENNKTMMLTWEFPAQQNKGLQGFHVQRAENPKQPFKTVNEKIIGNDQRSYEDTSPQQTNYYQVVAIALNGQEFRSPVYYAQLIDSVPPSAPKGLTGSIGDKGDVSLSWTPNPEPDTYGYRIYRANYKEEEFTQVTSAPVRSVGLVDTVNLQTLNREIHYQVMAVDFNQNYSALSEILTLKLPDKVKPVPPVFYPVNATQEGVQLQWIRSSSEDVSRYDVYRREGPRWRKISSVDHNADTLYRYIDKEGAEGKTQIYTVVAVDQSGLESEPASPVTGGRILNPVRPAVTLLRPNVDRQNKKIVLSWNYSQQGVQQYQVYRGREGQPMKLITSVTKTSFEDSQLTINSTYIYRVVAQFSSGVRSQFSDELKVVY